VPAIDEQAEGGPRPRILFCSSHCYLDPSSGAALSVRDLFGLLSARGWKCQVFCGSQLDFEDARPLQQVLREHHLPFKERPGSIGPLPGSLLNFQQGDVPVMVYQSRQVHSNPTDGEGKAFLALLERVLDWAKPDLVLTYGGHWLARQIITAVKRRGIPVVFWLCNLGYQEADLFRAVDGILVPSDFLATYYERALGLAATSIPCPLDWHGCQCEGIEGQYLTFVNPQPDKGLFWFAGLARGLRKQRPDIPLLVVEGRGGAGWLEGAGLDTAALGNLRTMANTPDPRTFYRITRAVLMPSLWQEPFGRVAAEACINGIPVLASRRGGLPQVLARAGFLFDIPERFSPQSGEVPTAEELSPWIETLIRLWDVDAFYQAQRQRCLQAAEDWRPQRLASQYDSYLKGILASSPALRDATTTSGAADAALQPEISIIMPVHNGSAFLERALRSVSRQTFERWELLVVDDGSTDDTYDRLIRYSSGDRRIRVFRLDKNRGCAAARNVAIGMARADTIAYLDCDDEFYPDYLANVSARKSNADVLVFAYDLLEERQAHVAVGQLTTHHPSRVRTLLMQQNIAVPLGVAHRRALLDKTGLFNEAAYYESDWDMWKRFARARALFLFVDVKSGLYHIRADSQARTHRIPDAAVADDAKASLA